MPYRDPEKQREYSRKWMAKRRSDWIEANGPCAQCGSTEKLQVDHVNSVDKDPLLKSRRIAGGIWSWSKVRLEAELAKCQVLCKPCHDEKTKTDYPERPHLIVVPDVQMSRIQAAHAIGYTTKELSEIYGVGMRSIQRYVYKGTRSHLGDRKKIKVR